MVRGEGFDASKLTMLTFSTCSGFSECLYEVEKRENYQMVKTGRDFLIAYGLPVVEGDPANDISLPC
jgi:hypothetical protein